jgi:hypothetical protein
VLLVAHLLLRLVTPLLLLLPLRVGEVECSRRGVPLHTGWHGSWCPPAGTSLCLLVLGWGPGSQCCCLEGCLLLLLPLLLLLEQ